MGKRLRKSAGLCKGLLRIAPGNTSALAPNPDVGQLSVRRLRTVCGDNHTCCIVVVIVLARKPRVARRVARRVTSYADLCTLALRWLRLAVQPTPESEKIDI